MNNKNLAYKIGIPLAIVVIIAGGVAFYKSSPKSQIYFGALTNSKVADVRDEVNRHPAAYERAYENSKNKQKVLPKATYNQKIEEDNDAKIRNDEEEYAAEGESFSSYNSDDGTEGGSRKRRRTNSKRQSKKRNNKRSKSTKRRHHSRQISKKKK
jgi:hypothetical protein